MSTKRQYQQKNLPSLRPGNDLERFHYARDRLVFQRAVFSFRLFSDDDEVQMTVARFEARQRVDAHHVGEEIDGLAQAHVRRVGVGSE